MLQDPIALYKQLNLFEKENGMNLTVKTPGSSHYEMTITDKHLSSPNNCHGGIIAALMDATIGSAALSLGFVSKNLVATVEFKISYFKPVHLGDKLVGTGMVDFEGKKLISSSGEIRNASKNNELVAKAIGTFNKYPIEKKEFGKMFL